MRKATVFWFAMAFACGMVLFHTSQEATDNRQKLRSLDRAMLREEESLRVLQAEWSYLNQPERLEKLARQYLQLEPLHGRQFSRLSDLNERVDENLLAQTEAQEMHNAFEPAAGEAEAAPSMPVAQDEPPAAPPKPASVKAPAPKVSPVAATPRAPAPAPVAASKYAPIAQPVIQMAPKPEGPRGFTDVMKSLGVE